ncbi:MAG: hypothetical protein O3B65_04705 [Chloroflexi bacterium]|nr:hypothetical protein [Chloroflexota bacterium]
MSTLVGVFEQEQGAQSAREILTYGDYDATVLRRSHDPYDAPVRFKHRGEVMLRAAVKWGIVGALIIEIPALALLLMLPVDINVKVFMGATVWKFGAAFGAWIGAMSAGERGLDAERAEDYEDELISGRRLLSVNVASRDRRFARGAILESGAVEVRDVVGTFEVKV